MPETVTKQTSKASALHFKDEVITFKTIEHWIEGGKDLEDKQVKLLADYLTRKKRMQDNWLEDDRKKFLRAKRFLAKQKEVVS